VVVQKRHHTRLFASNHNDTRSVDKSGNILPGQLVCEQFRKADIWFWQEIAECAVCSQVHSSVEN